MTSSPCCDAETALSTCSSCASLGRIKEENHFARRVLGTSKRLPGIGDRGACWSLSTRLSPRRRLTGLKAVAHALWGRRRDAVDYPFGIEAQCIVDELEWN